MSYTGWLGILRLDSYHPQYIGGVESPIIINLRSWIESPQFEGGMYPKCQVDMFQGVVEGGRESASLHFEGILRTPQERHEGDV